MKFIHRLGFYLGGFALGLVLLFFFLGGKKASCAYGPNARTLKNIRIKERVIPENITKELAQKKLDTSVFTTLLVKGNVLFSESNTKLDSCKIYTIEGTVDKTYVKTSIENCDTKATVLSISF